MTGFEETLFGDAVGSESFLAALQEFLVINIQL
jgi:hypothetical protein